jgi:hypothetical protein
MLPVVARAPLPTRDVADRSAEEPPPLLWPIVDAIWPSLLPPELGAEEREPPPADRPALEGTV